MANLPMFKKAVKREARARVALIGVSGSGKSYTSLVLARLLAGPTGKIAAVDTEHGSLSKYADLFDFDVLELESYTPDNFTAALSAAENAGYDVFLTDSLSHFWMGKDGALEFVDERKKAAKTKGGDQMEGWKDFRPHERAMIDRIIGSRCHVVCTMRTKNDYVMEEYTDSQGKKKTKRTKVGLAPVQREGLEYEFDLVGTLNEDNELYVEKSRVMLPDGSNPYQGRVFHRPNAQTFGQFREWLKGAPADRPADRPAPPQPPPPPQQQQPQQPKPAPVATPKPAEQPKPAPATPLLDPIERAMAEFRNADKYGRLKLFGQAKKDIEECTGAESDYYRILVEVGKVEKCDQFKSMGPATATYRALLLFIAKVTAEPPLPEPAKTDASATEPGQAGDWMDGMNGDIDAKFEGATA